MELSAQELCQWFESNLNTAMFIQKKEQGDLDQIELEVREVALLQQNETFDEYMPSLAIVLKGIGTIRNEDGEKVRLPEDYYEIPLHGLSSGIQEAGKIQITTDRAHYTIQPQ